MPEALERADARPEAEQLHAQRGVEVDTRRRADERLPRAVVAHVFAAHRDAGRERARADESLLERERRRPLGTLLREPRDLRGVDDAGVPHAVFILETLTPAEPAESQTAA